MPPPPPGALDGPPVQGQPTPPEPGMPLPTFTGPPPTELQPGQANPDPPLPIHTGPPPVSPDGNSAGASPGPAGPPYPDSYPERYTYDPHGSPQITTQVIVINATATLDPSIPTADADVLPGATGGGTDPGVIVGAVLGTLAGLLLVGYLLRKYGGVGAAKAAKDKKMNPWDEANMLGNQKNENVHVTTAVNQRYVYPGLIAHSELKK